MKQQQPKLPSPTRKRSAETVKAQEIVIKKILAPVKKETGHFSSSPDPNSRRSKRRRNRGFVSLTVSSRKHRRNARRQFEERKKTSYW